MEKLKWDLLYQDQKQGAKSGKSYRQKQKQKRNQLGNLAHPTPRPTTGLASATEIPSTAQVMNQQELSSTSHSVVLPSLTTSTTQTMKQPALLPPLLDTIPSNGGAISKGDEWRITEEEINTIIESNLPKGDDFEKIKGSDTYVAIETRKGTVFGILIGQEKSSSMCHIKVIFPTDKLIVTAFKHECTIIEKTNLPEIQTNEIPRPEMMIWDYNASQILEVAGYPEISGTEVPIWALNCARGEESSLILISNLAPIPQKNQELTVKATGKRVKVKTILEKHRELYIETQCGNEFPVIELEPELKDTYKYRLNTEALIAPCTSPLPTGKDLNGWNSITEELIEASAGAVVDFDDTLFYKDIYNEANGALLDQGGVIQPEPFGPGVDKVLSILSKEKPVCIITARNEDGVTEATTLLRTNKFLEHYLKRGILSVKGTIVNKAETNKADFVPGDFHDKQFIADDSQRHLNSYRRRLLPQVTNVLVNVFQ